MFAQHVRWLAAGLTASASLGACAVDNETDSEAAGRGKATVGSVTCVLQRDAWEFALPHSVKSYTEPSLGVMFMHGEGFSDVSGTGFQRSDFRGKLVGNEVPTVELDVSLGAAVAHTDSEKVKIAVPGQNYNIPRRHHRQPMTHFGIEGDAGDFVSGALQETPGRRFVTLASFEDNTLRNLSPERRSELAEDLNKNPSCLQRHSLNKQTGTGWSYHLCLKCSWNWGWDGEFSDRYRNSLPQRFKNSI